MKKIKGMPIQCGQGDVVDDVDKHPIPTPTVCIKGGGPCCKVGQSLNNQISFQ
jgi:hypothetical protein